MCEAVAPILDSDLPAAQQVTLMHLHRQSEGGLFVGTHQDIADARGVSRGTVSEQIRTLIEKGWAESCGQALRVFTAPTTSENETPSSTDGGSASEGGGTGQGFPLSSLPFSPKKVHSTPFNPSLLSPSQVDLEPLGAAPPRWLWLKDRWDSIREELPKDHPARWGFHPGDWRFDYAKLALVRMREFDMLSPMVEKKIDRQSEGSVAAEWADTFRKLCDLDGYTRDEIETALQWLFRGGNFWTDEGGIASVTALRKKTRTGDRRKFDVIYQQATRNSAGDGAPVNKSKAII